MRRGPVDRAIMSSAAIDEELEPPACISCDVDGSPISRTPVRRGSIASTKALSLLQLLCSSDRTHFGKAL